MRKVKNQFSERLSDYVKLFKALSKCYDEGDEIVALSLATAIRVLVHDTDKSTSLLTHLDLKRGWFLSSNLKDTRERVHLGLVRRINVGVHDGKGGEAKYWPTCDERYFSSPTQHFLQLEFDNWWTEVVFKNDQHELTRKDLVLTVTNKDGGAHFDGKVEEKYDQFRQYWSGGSCLVGIHSGAKRGYDNIPIYPAIRQIAFEILHSEFGNLAQKNS